MTPGVPDATARLQAVLADARAVGQLPTVLRPTRTYLAGLTPEQVMTLLDVLREKEKQKLVARRADRKARSIDVEKDW